jgi:hypothetical protein
MCRDVAPGDHLAPGVVKRVPGHPVVLPHATSIPGDTVHDRYPFMTTGLESLEAEFG